MSDFNRFNSWKALRYCNKMEAIAEGAIPYPVIWHVYASNRCNMNCEFCIMKKEKSEHNVMLPCDLLFKAVDDACRCGSSLINFTGGGEPLTNPYVAEAIQRAYESECIKVGLFTNGVLLDPSMIKYINHLRVSVNASNSATHSKIMGSLKLDFYSVLDNIGEAVYNRNENIYSKDYHDIGMAFLITPDNWWEVYDFAKIGSNLGVDFLHYRPAWYPKEDPRNLELMDIVVNKMSKMREEVMQDFGNKMQIGFVTEKFEGYWSKRDYTKCRANPMMAVLAADGKFLICQDVFKRFGDYYKQSFDEIWYGDEHKKAMESIDLDACPRCVETRMNQMIEHMFVNNDARCELL